MAVHPSSVATIGAKEPGSMTPPGSVIMPSSKPKGSPGSSYLPPGTSCPESVAMMAGKAVTFVGADKKCQGLQGITITIGDTHNGIHSGFSMVNVNFGCNGEQGCCASPASLPGPVVA